MIVVASYVFYGWWDYRFLSLLAISTISDYWIARGIHATSDEPTKKRLVGVSLVVNLGILGFFKYFNFFTESAAELLGSLGLEASPPSLQIILPVGISFYTFQTLSYTIDVYRGRIQPEDSMVTFAAYVSFFPQLVAGPIERAQHLLPQLRVKQPFPTANEVSSALALIVTGLFKKIVLADGVAGFVDETFADPTQFGTLSLIFAVYAFAIQIYGDFSGYSSIARGVARLLGIELIRNFEQPYLSTSITQFWRTWHISLSNWLWDYLYIPLGGNRKGRRRTYINLMLTMLLGGLWHGAGWTFVVWGGLHGAFLAVHRLLGRYVPRGKPPTPQLRQLPWIVLNFHLVCVAWIFFRADSFASATNFMANLVALRFSGEYDPTILLVCLFALTMIGLDVIDRMRNDLQPLVRWGPVRIGTATAAMLAGIIVFSGGTPQPFIYFQF